MGNSFKELTALNLFKWLVLASLVFLTAFYTLPWTIEHALTMEYSGLDFHGYWYAGHFVRQGVNSYAAILNARTPNYWNPAFPGSGNPNLPSDTEQALVLPIRYLDGPVVTEHPVARAMIVVPAVTAPLNLTLGLFAWFSWPTARLLWMLFNLAFAFSIPWLALRLLDGSIQLERVDTLIFAFVFYNFYGVRQSIVVGQQALVCLFLLLLALLASRNRPWVSGLLLGLGISKYSVGTPTFLYYAIRKRFLAIMVALALQGFALLALLFLERGSPFETILAYFRIFAVNASQNGVHLLARFDNRLLQAILFVLISILTITGLVRCATQRNLTDRLDGRIGLQEINLLTVSIFMVTYHRIHDMSFMIFFFLLWVVSTLEAKAQVNWLTVGGILALFLLMFPTLPAQMLPFLPPDWLTVEAVSSLTLVFVFAMSLVVVRQHPASGLARRDGVR